MYQCGPCTNQVVLLLFHSVQGTTQYVLGWRSMVLRTGFLSHCTLLTPQLEGFILIILLNTSYKSGVHPAVFFEGANTEAIKNFCGFKNYVIKIKL